MLELARAPQDHSWDRESDVPGLETSLETPSILKRCLLPQTIAGTAGDRPHRRGSFFVTEYVSHAQIRSAGHVRALDAPATSRVLEEAGDNTGDDDQSI